MNGNDTQRAQAAAQFLGWLSRYSPEVFAMVMEQVPEAAEAISTPSNMMGLGQTPTTAAQKPEEVPWWQQAIDIAGSVATQYLQYEAQKDVLKVQQERASRGLPPIPSDVYAPTIRHQVDIPPEFKQAAMGGGTLLALGLGAAVLLYFATR